MEALIDLLAWSLESDKALTLDNGLPALATDDCFPFHGPPPAPCFVFLVGQFDSNRLEVLVRLLQASAGLVDGSENGDVVDRDVPFPLVLPEKLLE